MSGKEARKHLIGYDAIMREHSGEREEVAPSLHNSSSEAGSARRNKDCGGPPAPWKGEAPSIPPETQKGESGND